MEAFYEVKTVDNSVKDVDSGSRRVKVVLSEMGSIDLDGDAIDAEAYTKTIKERGPNGSNLIWHLTDHDTTLKSAVGKFKELYTQGNQLIGVTDIPKTSWGSDVLEFYKSGIINQHSIGFKTIKSEQVNKGKSGAHTLIKEVMLYEGSAVLYAANPATPTLSVGKSLGERTAAYEKLNNELSFVFNAVKSGSYTDATFELLEMRIKQVQERLKQLFTTRDETKAGGDYLTLEKLKSINQLFKPSVAEKLRQINQIFK